MSNTQDVGRATAVMVRAYGEESVRLWALNIGDGVVEATGEDRAASMVFPAEDVFKFEASLFAQLKGAYEDQSTERLRSLWSRAQRFAPIIG
jgi:hypothetical protein